MSTNNADSPLNQGARGSTGSAVARSTALAICSGVAGAAIGLVPTESHRESDWGTAVKYGLASTIGSGALNWGINKCLRSFGHQTEFTARNFRATLERPSVVAMAFSSLALTYPEVSRGTVTAIAASAVGVAHASAYWPEICALYAHLTTPASTPDIGGRTASEVSWPDDDLEAGTREGGGSTGTIETER